MVGIVFTALGWVAALVLAEIAVSCAYRIASARWRFLPRWSPLVPDAGWLLPELCGGACLILLVLLGIAPVLGGTLLATALYAAASIPLGHVMWQAKKQGQGGYAARRIASRLLLLIRTAPAILMEDVRALAGRRAADDSPPAGPGTPRQPVRATPGVPPWRRSVPGVPSIHADPALGGAPAPADVAVALEAAGVTVPPSWAAVAADAAELEPENEDELCEHMDGEAAGILTWAEGVMARAENLGEGGAGLHPAYVAAHYEFADDIAELASHAAQVSKRYHQIHDDLREAADGTPLPANRYWFGDGGAPQGGQAA
jgi:hypothetical protein